MVRNVQSCYAFDGGRDPAPTARGIDRPTKTGYCPDRASLTSASARIRAVLAYGLVCLIAAGAVATLFMLLTARGS